jgi:hypothetical protein
VSAVHVRTDDKEGKHGGRDDGRQSEGLAGDLRAGSGAARHGETCRRIFRVAGPSPNGGWRVIEVFESDEDAQRFVARLKPAFEAVGVPGPPPPQFWPVHNYMK